MVIAETAKMAGLLFCQFLSSASMTIKRRTTIVPYQITPSKKGSLPKGVLMGNSGSRTKLPNLPIIARKITPSVNAMRKFINEKSIRTPKVFLEVFSSLYLMDLPAVVYGYVME